ncbi:hypothetical protein QF026_004048 [Streptomyces aurantiacus]|nr:hypothetical protein [Streptomyces aurantiacus]
MLVGQYLTDHQLILRQSLTMAPPTRLLSAPLAALRA